MRKTQIIKFINAIAVLLILFISRLTAIASLHTGPYLSFVNSPESSIVISWIDTDNDVLTISLEKVNPYSFIDSKQSTPIYEQSIGWIHHVEFTGLEVNTLYEYTIDYDPNDVTAQFRTAKELATDDAFVIVGDTQDQSGSTTAIDNVAYAITSYAGGNEPLMILHTGDVSNRPYLLDEKFLPVYDQYHILDTRPFMSCLGNHDVKNGGGGSPPEYNVDRYRAVFKYPDNYTNDDEDELNYSFDYDNIHFVMLNTELWKFPDSWPTAEDRTIQIDWLEKDLADAENADYRIIMHHYPHNDEYQHNPDHSWTLFYEDSVYQRLCPIYETYNVQAVFSGHRHHFLHELINGVDYITAGGGGGGLHSLTQDQKPFGTDDHYHYLRLEVQSDGDIHIIPLSDGNVILQDEGGSPSNLDFEISPDATGTEISGNQSGTLSKGVYYVTGDITVSQGNTLILAPGVRLVFKGNYEIDVNGTLEIKGNSAGDQVKLLGKTGITWKGIQFGSTSSNNSIDSCYISDCEIGITTISANVTISRSRIFNITNFAILVSSADVSITDCDIENAPVGVFASSADVTVSGCNISEVDSAFVNILSDMSIADSKIECAFYGLKETGYSPSNSITITRCSFDGNGSQHHGIHINGGDFTLQGHYPSYPTVTGFDIGVYCQNAEVTFEDASAATLNTVAISGNPEWGVYLSNCTNSTLTYTDFSSNGDVQATSACGGLYLYATSPALEKCYFSYNYGYAAYADNESDACFGEYDNSNNGNEFKNNMLATYNTGIIHEAGDSYPLFNERYNNLYQGNFGEFIYNEDLEGGDGQMVVDYNYWGDVEGPEEEDFYPEGFYCWEPFCESPNTIGQAEDDGKGGGKDSDLGDGLETGIALEKLGEYRSAVKVYLNFIRNSDNVLRRKVAMRRMLSASIEGGLNLDSLLGCYQSIVRRAVNPSIGRNAARLQTRALEATEDYEGAIRDYEVILLNQPEYEDSIYTVIDAGRAYLLLKERNGGVLGSFTPEIPGLEPSDWGEYAVYREALLEELHRYRMNRIAGETPGGAAVAELPLNFALHQNLPNPFNPLTQIGYDLPELSDVKLEIFNITGRKVITLINGLEQAGYKSVVWNGIDDRGKAVCSGIYLYRITVLGQNSGAKFSQSAKMILLK